MIFGVYLLIRKRGRLALRPCCAAAYDMPFDCAPFDRLRAGRTGGSPLNPAPTGDLRLPADKHTGILTDFQTKGKKKMKKKCFFWPFEFDFTDLNKTYQEKSWPDNPLAQDYCYAQLPATLLQSFSQNLYSPLLRYT